MAKFLFVYRAEKGTSALDQRHRLTVNSIWSPMLWHGGGRMRNFLLNNWQLSQISTFASGPHAIAVISVSGAPFPGAAFNTTLNGFGASTRVPFWPMNNLDMDPVESVTEAGGDVSTALDRERSRLPECERVRLPCVAHAFRRAKPRG